MLHKTKGIVLHAIKYGDTSLIAHIYTRDFGRQSYIVNGVRGKKGKFHFNHFQTLTILDLQVDHKPNRELQRIREITVTQPLHHIQANIIKSTIALFVGEVLYRSLKDNEANVPVFNYLEGAIQILDLNDNGYVNFHLVFLIQFSRFLGIFPGNSKELDEYQPKNADYFLHDLMHITLKDMDSLELDVNSRKMLLAAMIDYYYYHLEGMGKIASLKVLNEVFS